MGLLMLWYQNAELYAIFLVWVVLPLGFYAAYLFLRRNFGMFEPTTSIRAARLRRTPIDASHRPTP